MKIIGISGKKGSGKDTAADAIIRTLGDVPILRTAFADELKEELCGVLGITRDALELNKGMFRPLLQWWGTEWRRHCFGNDYWINRLNEKLARAAALPYPVLPIVRNYPVAAIVTDVRFANEKRWLTERGGVSIRVLRLGMNVENPATDAPSGHASECELDGASFDYTLNNGGTKEEFQRDVARFANRVLTQRMGLPMRGGPEGDLGRRGSAALPEEIEKFKNKIT